MYKQRLKKYIEEDVIYQDYKKQKEFESSDFDNFCILHREDIEEALFDLEQLRKENNQLKEQIIKLKLSNKYKNILYDLKEWLEIEKVVTMDTMKIFAFSDVLSKLNELEGGKNE